MDPIGLYLHIPFCDGKCAYCNFFSRRPNEDDTELNEYTEHLIGSIWRSARACSPPARALSTSLSAAPPTPF